MTISCCIIFQTNLMLTYQRGGREYVMRALLGCQETLAMAILGKSIVTMGDRPVQQTEAQKRQEYDENDLLRRQLR